MANSPLETGCYYHLYNRGVEKRNIFLSHSDYLRFLEAIAFYQKTPTPMKLSDFRRGKAKFKKTEAQTDLVRIFCYCLMPNHFHLSIQQLQEKGVTIFLKRLLDSYTRYFNTKYERVGTLFQGSSKAKLVENDEYLLQLSKYIHRNPFPLDKWGAKTYPYSSYNYYLTRKPRSSFCEADFILSYFSKSNPKLGYQEFVEEEELNEPDLYAFLIDSDQQ